MKSYRYSPLSLVRKIYLYLCFHHCRTRRAIDEIGPWHELIEDVVLLVLAVNSFYQDPSRFEFVLMTYDALA